MDIRDRIKRFDRVPASSLKPNPKNWRTHPQAQRDALTGVLSEVGIADACIAYEQPDGSLTLIDGHLRAETLPDERIPCLILDVTDKEADTILATLDPLGSLATRNEELLSELVTSIDTDDAGLRRLLDTLAPEEWMGQEPVDDDEVGEYNPDSETVLIKVEKVPRDRKDEAVAVLDKALSELEIPYSVKALG